MVCYAWAMYAHTVSSYMVYSTSNSKYIVCPLGPHHHRIILIHNARSTKHPKNASHWQSVHCNTDTAASIRFQYWCLSLVVSVHAACTQNSFYHFRMVVTHAIFGLLAVAGFLKSSIMTIADRIKDETVITVKAMIQFLGCIHSIARLELSIKLFTNTNVYVLYNTFKQNLCRATS